MVAKISWTHNPILIEKYKGLLKREFYLRMVKKYGWSKSILIHQIESETYEQYILNQTNFDKALDDKDNSQDINPKAQPGNAVLVPRQEPESPHHPTECDHEPLEIGQGSSGGTSLCRA